MGHETINLFSDCLKCEKTMMDEYAIKKHVLPLHSENGSP